MNAALLQQVTSVSEGVVYGETDGSNAFWQTLLAGSKNVFNLGGNIETRNLTAPPLLITFDGLTCELVEVMSTALGLIVADCSTSFNRSCAFQWGESKGQDSCSSLAAMSFAWQDLN